MLCWCLCLFCSNKSEAVRVDVVLCLRMCVWMLCCQCRVCLPSLLFGFVFAGRLLILPVICFLFVVCCRRSVVVEQRPDLPQLRSPPSPRLVGSKAGVLVFLVTQSGYHVCFAPLKSCAAMSSASLSSCRPCFLFIRFSSPAPHGLNCIPV